KNLSRFSSTCPPDFAVHFAKAFAEADCSDGFGVEKFVSKSKKCVEAQGFTPNKSSTVMKFSDFRRKC
ncbi:hypothetical protein AVEN_173469-1, partial [Araneus ventricosus]